jgi:hypothetical protein
MGTEHFEATAKNWGVCSLRARLVCIKSETMAFHVLRPNLHIMCLMTVANICFRVMAAKM